MPHAPSQPPSPAPLAPLPAAGVARLRQAFLLGLNGNAPPLPETAGAAIRAAGLEGEAPLIALALAVQAQRFARPALARPGAVAAAGTPPEAARRLHDDPRPILPEAARLLLGRLMKGAKAAVGGRVMWSALVRLNACGLRLHPFDLPGYEEALKANPEALGPAERAFLALTAPEPRPGAQGDGEAESLLHERIDTENWRSFSKAPRLAFLKALRLNDPGAGRVLVEGCFGQEPAALRAELVAALEAGLSPDDQAFLEGLEKDRAETVRAAAARLLGRLPGTPAHGTRIARALETLKAQDSGAVAFKPPARNKTAAEAMTRELFTDLSVTALAASLNLTPAAFLSALPDKAGPLFAILLPTALAEGDGETIRILTSRLGCSDLMTGASLARDSRATIRPEARAAFAAGFVSRLNDCTQINSLALSDLGTLLGGPLPVPLADAWLASACWKRALEALARTEGSWRDCDPDLALYTALIMPAERLPRFLAAIEPIRPEAARQARDFAAFAQALPPGEPGATSPACP